MNSKEIVAAVRDEDEAQDLVHALFSRFGWSGTWFMRQDARDAVAERLSEVMGEYVDPDNHTDELEGLTDLLMESYGYLNLDDQFAEVGNRILADEAADLIPEDMEIAVPRQVEVQEERP